MERTHALGVAMLRTVAAIALAISLAGCVEMETETGYGPPVTPFTVRSSAAEGFTPTARHAVVVTDFSQKAQADSAELIGETRRMLQAAGVPVVREGERLTAADVRVSVAYDVGQPEFSSYTIRKPVYGTTGIASKRTVTQTSKHGDRVSETTYTPRTEIVGYDEEVRPLVKFTHTLSLVARKGSAKDPVWSVRVSHIDSTGSRDYAAQMLLAAQSYIGKGGDAVDVGLVQNDPRLAFILAGSAEESPKAGAHSKK